MQMLTSLLIIDENYPRLTRPHAFNAITDRGGLCDNRDNREFKKPRRRRTASINKRHAMHAEAMTFHKGSLRIFRKFDRKFQES